MNFHHQKKIVPSKHCANHLQTHPLYHSVLCFLIILSFAFRYFYSSHRLLCFPSYFSFRIMSLKRKLSDGPSDIISPPRKHATVDLFLKSKSDALKQNVIDIISKKQADAILNGMANSITFHVEAHVYEPNSFDEPNRFFYFRVIEKDQDNMCDVDDFILEAINTNYGDEDDEDDDDDEDDEEDDEDGEDDEDDEDDDDHVRAKKKKLYCCPGFDNIVEDLDVYSGGFSQLREAWEDYNLVRCVVVFDSDRWKVEVGTENRYGDGFDADVTVLSFLGDPFDKRMHAEEVSEEIGDASQILRLLCRKWKEEEGESGNEDVEEEDQEEEEEEEDVADDSE
jgi:hypothetical protein